MLFPQVPPRRSVLVDHVVGLLNADDQLATALGGPERVAAHRLEAVDPADENEYRGRAVLFVPTRIADRAGSQLGAVRFGGGPVRSPGYATAWLQLLVEFPEGPPGVEAARSIEIAHERALEVIRTTGPARGAILNDRVSIAREIQLYDEPTPVALSEGGAFYSSALYAASIVAARP